VTGTTAVWKGGIVSARQCIIAAGAIGTPRLLARSGNTSPALGRHVSDHPAIAFPIRPLTDHQREDDQREDDRQDLSPRTSRVSMVGRFHSSGASTEPPDLQVMPIERFTDATGQALLMIALTSPQSRGVIDVQSERPRLDLHHLEDATDRRRLRDGVRTTLRALTDRAIRDHVRVEFGEGQPDAAELIDSSDGDLDGWMSDHLGGYFHVCGSARAGAPDTAVADLHGRVHGATHPGATHLGATHLWVGDVSLCPVPPSGNPMLVAMAIGEAVGRAVAATLAD
jgi:choline dehydrogenase